jgi:hypothetical protein
MLPLMILALIFAIGFATGYASRAHLSRRHRTRYLQYARYRGFSPTTVHGRRAF